MTRRAFDSLADLETIIELVRWRAARHPARCALSFLAEGDTAAGEQASLTYEGLDRRARSIGARLQSLGLAGERALLLYPPGLEFVAAFCGCVYAGVVAVPAHTPRANRPMPRLRAIVSDAQPAAVLSTGALLRQDGARWTAAVPDLASATSVATDELTDALADDWRDPETSRSALAFLQYTSGSTAAPKGVMVTHANLLANSMHIRAAFQSSEQGRGVFWLPLFHDMGLIGGVLQTIHCGGSSTLISPIAFLQRPLRWLDLITRTGAIISGAPNFAYDLCARKVTAEQKAKLDLSRWAVAFNGAEPIRPETLDQFAEAFAPCGFRREAFLPCYGLAEATLFVSGGPADREPEIVPVDSRAFEEGRVAPAGAGARLLVTSGRVADGLDVAIVDPETQTRCAGDRVGEIWVRGPSVAQGYWGQPEATEQTFHASIAPTGEGPYLRTGDMGFLQGDQLVVTGRLKDLIIIRGRNVYPQDVEWTVERSHPALRAGAGAAFAVEQDGEERLVVVQEVERAGKSLDTSAIHAAIHQAVAQEHELDLHAICLVRPLTIPRTSSGKIQRRACHDAFLAGSLEVVDAWTRASSTEAYAAEPPARRSAEEIARWLAARVAGPLGVKPDEVDLQQPFDRFGLGSMQAVALASALEQWLGRPLAPTLAYEYPNIRALAEYLADDGRTPHHPNDAATEDERAEGHTAAEPIAIVGLSCRFPGADDPEAFWRLLRDGRDAVSEVPPGRWRGHEREHETGEDTLPHSPAVQRGGFLSQVDEFDADFFGISPREAACIDPQQRILLELAWEALEDAGQAPERLAGTAVGVFIGITTGDYGRLTNAERAAGDAYLLTGNAPSIAANRISYVLDFRGPSLAIDTACSSSLVAVHQAVQSLRSGESTVALAGGVSLILTSDVSAQLARAGFLAADGRCKTFDARGDGYVRGEGAGLVVLKPLSRAQADGDRVYAVIRGSAINQDGRTNGLTAPSRQAQEAVLRAGCRRAGVSPGQIHYVEAHGTGTLLGDPIEAAALGTVLAEGRDPGSPCAVGSVKSNIGHLEAAAGIAGLIKVALALSHRALPASLHFDEPNPHIPFDALPLRVQSEPGAWPETDGPWLAGVSSFGFGGTNAHVVVEEAPGSRDRAHPAPVVEPAELVLPLSARNPEALRALARSFRDWLAARDPNVSLRDVLYTAAVRRAHHDHRLVVRVRSEAEAVAALDAFVNEEPHAALRAGRRQPLSPTVVTGEDAADRYAAGFDVDWRSLYPTGRPVRLPGYPWQRRRYWLDAEPRDPTAARVRLGSHVSTNGNGRAVADHAGPGRLTEALAVGDEDVSDLISVLRWHGLDALAPVSSADVAGRWLLFADAGGVGRAFSARLETLGASCVVVRPGGEGDDASGCDRLLDPADRSALERLIGSNPAGWRGVVHLWSLDAAATDQAELADVERAQRLGCGTVLLLAQVMAASHQANGPRLWVVTRGAQAAGAGPHPLAVLQAPVWGLGRSIALEEHGIWGGLIDLDPAGGESQVEVEALLAQIGGGEHENQVALRGGQRLGARLVRGVTAMAARPPEIRPDGTYLVTGGLGELGLRTARWLVDRGARRLVLVGRRGLPPRPAWDGLPEGGAHLGAIEAIRALERLGATVLVESVDVADRERMTALFDRLRGLLPPVRGVVHAAGVAAPQTLTDLDSASLAEALRAKVAGTWVLHELTRRHGLDFFIGFSSLAAVLGAREPHYAAANHFLDAFAHHASAAGTPALSVNWGPWQGEGMAASRERAHRLLGLEPLPSARAFAALEHLLKTGAPQAVVAAADWCALKALYVEQRASRLFDTYDVPPHSNGEVDHARPAPNGWRSLPQLDRRDWLVRFLRDRVAAALEQEPTRVDVERPLSTMGVDSLTAIEIRLAVEKELRMSLPMASLMDGATIVKLAEHALGAAEHEAAAAGAPLVPMRVVPDCGHPLSVGQMTLWLAHQFEPTEAADNIAGAARVRAEIDEPALRRVLQQLVDRHEALRTAFPSTDGRPALRVEREGQAEVQVEHVPGCDDAELMGRLVAEARRPFDLERGPLYRVALFRRSERDNVLLLVIHHSVADFWSTAVLLDEFGRLYAAECAGRREVLAPIELQYTDFIRWQAEMLAGPAGERLWGYWQKQLAGPLPELNLPTDRPRPAVRSQRGAMRHLELDQALTHRLTALAEAAGASAYTCLLAAFQVLLARYSGQDDIIVGSPVAGRTRAGLEGVVGYFVNLVPMRANLAGNPTFAELLTQVRRVVHDGLEHQDYPHGLLVQRLQPDRDPSRTPLFQVMFIYQKAHRLDQQGLTPFALAAPGHQMRLGGLPLESLPLDKQTALFDLTLSAAQAGGRLCLAVEYCTDLFEAASIDRLLGHYQTLLGSLVANPGQPIGNLPLLTDAERQQVLEAWSGRPALPTQQLTGIHRLVEEHARLRPEQPAVVLGEESLSYGALDALSSQLAHHLRSRGVGPEVVVGLCLRRSPRALVGLLGILKAGGAYLPLDPDHPDDRLAALMEDAGVALVMTDESIRPRLAGTRAEAVCLDGDQARLAGYPEQAPDVPVEPGNLAYVVYTSGSTGKPKGVLVTHAGLLAAYHAWAEAYALHERPMRHLQMAGVAFDVFAGDWIRGLCSGGTLVICPRETLLDPPALADLLERERIECAEFVPAVAVSLIRECEERPRSLAFLKLIAVGSDTWHAGQHERLRRLVGPGGRVVNSYGLTEATIDSTYFEGSLAALPPDRPAPIGRPFAGTRVYVLDRNGEPVPVGVPGELHVGGAGVARGYWGRPALTAERFVPDPFSPTPGGRLYRTGDLVRWRADGVLELLGRTDDQVKIRGFRVELAEVEATLLRHPRVREAAAIVRQDALSAPARLAAFVVLRESSEPDAEPAQLRRWLKQRLPEFMVPASLRALDALPLSPNGKVDRRALAALELAPVEAPAGEAAPFTPTQATLARLAADVLGVPAVGLHDRFFDLGIDSIVMIQIVARARQEGLHVMPAQLFQYPTIAELAGVIDASPAVAPAPDTEPAPAPTELLPEVDRQALAQALGEGRGVEDVYPLTPVQEGMLYHSLLEPSSGVYVEQFTCRLRGSLDAQAFERAWQAALARHPALRTAFHWLEADRPVQVVYRDVELPIEYEDWSRDTADAQADRLTEYLRADRTRGFVPSWAPLFRVAVMRLGDDLHQLIWSGHHAIIDGWSLPILLGDVLAGYEAALRGDEPSRAPSQPFCAFVAWLLARDESRAEAFWKRELAGFRRPTPLGIETRVVPQGDQAEPFAEQEHRLQRHTSAGLRALAQAHQVTLSTIVQGAWALLLSRYSGQREVVFGAVVSGRPPELPGVEATIGMFINTLPVRVHVAEDEPVGRWLQQLQRRLVELRQFESTPPVRVHACSEVPHGSLLFESILVFQNTPVSSSLSERASRLGVEDPRLIERTHYPLTLTVMPGADLLVRVGYDTRRVDPGAVERMLGHFVTLLAELATGADQTLAELRLLSAAEQEQLLRHGNAARNGAAAHAVDGVDAAVDDLRRIPAEVLDSWIEELERSLKGDS